MHYLMPVWTPEFLAQWTADRRAGIQTDAETKIYIQPRIWTEPTKHWYWVLGKPGGVKDDYSVVDPMYR